jgi:hypothetical protein
MVVQIPAVAKIRARVPAPASRVFRIHFRFLQLLPILLAAIQSAAFRPVFGLDSYESFSAQNIQTAAPRPSSLVRLSSCPVRLLPPSGSVSACSSVASYQHCPLHPHLNLLPPLSLYTFSSLNFQLSAKPFFQQQNQLKPLKTNLFSNQISMSGRK